MAKRPVASSVADYIASFPPRVRAALKQVRRTVRAAAPGVGEGISYAIVKFELGGKYVFYMAGWPEHVGIYPVNGAVAAAFTQELAPYTSGKATVRFPLSEPMPLDLIERMVRARVAELGAATPAKKKGSARGDGASTRPARTAKASSRQRATATAARPAGRTAARRVRKQTT